jgi:SecD/SecF fusion protein
MSFATCKFAVLSSLLAVFVAACSGGGRLSVKGGGVGFLFALEHPGSGAAKAMETALHRRLDAAGLRDGRVKLEGDDRIRVLVPGVAESMVESLQQVLTRPSRLAFSLVDEDNPFLENLAGRLPGDGSVQLAVETNPGISKGAPRRTCYLTATNRKKLMTFLSGLTPPPGRRIGIMRGEWGLLAYLIVDPPAFAGARVKESRVIDGGGPDGSGRVAVEIRLADEQRQTFAQLTRENIHRRLAILVDDEIRSAPIIEAVIESGRALIGASPIAPVALAEREAHSLAASLMAWSLAGDLRLIERKLTSPATH